MVIQPKAVTACSVFMKALIHPNLGNMNTLNNSELSIQDFQVIEDSSPE